MKTQIFIIALFFALLSTFSSCSVVEGIFKTGVGVGVFSVALVIVLIIFLVTRMGKNK